MYSFFIYKSQNRYVHKEYESILNKWFSKLFKTDGLGLSYYQELKLGVLGPAHE